VNLYQYVGNNPATYTDPFGLCPPIELCKLGFIMIGAESLGDTRTNAEIATLKPVAQVKATQLVNLSKLSGTDLRVTEGYRSPAEQTKRYAVGRRGIEGERIITNAGPGESSHQTGSAFDTAIIERGEAVWDLERFREVAEIGNALGLIWGGNFMIRDGPHFELPQ
jgi:hypothetical protein